MTLSLSDVLQMDQRFRATFMNSLAGIRPAVLVGTRGRNDINNLAVFNSLIHIGADPPRSGLLFRPVTVERHTLENLRTSGSYSINFVKSSDFRRAHQTSAKYPVDASEFEAVGFTPVFEEGYHAPMVAEADIRLLMSFEFETEIPLNGTILVIGRIQRIMLPDQIVQPDGYVDHEMADSLSCAGLDAYFRVENLGRMPYARPETNPAKR